MTDAAMRVAKALADYDRRLKALERAPRLKNASMEGASLPVYDGDQTLRQVIGAQPDGSYTITDVNGPPPPMPTQPLVEARPGTLVITWDGKFLDDATPPADWDHVEVHVSPVFGYDTSDATEIITLHSLKGGSVTVALDAVPQYVRLQSVNTSRVESAATPQVAATPLPAATGTGGIKTYYENAAPVGLDVDDDGSLWYDTDDSNHPYRWDGSTLAWVSVQDGSIAAAAAAASAAQTQANDALTAAQAAQATADGAIRTYYQSAPPWPDGSTQPPEVVGDLWYDLDDGQAYRWNGTAWAIIEDNSIAAALAAAQNAQTTADGKITSYYQTTPPATGELGDLWYDTDDKNKPYYCSAVSPVTWTSVRDGTIADAQATANTALATVGTVAPDGTPPASSPTPSVTSGIESMIVRWTPITNHDPVTYDVHVSATADFAPDTSPDAKYAHWWVSGPLNLDGYTAPDYPNIPTSRLVAGDRFLYPGSGDKYTWNGTTWVYDGPSGTGGAAGDTIMLTAGSTTRVGSTAGSQFTIRALPGAPPTQPGAADPRVLAYGTTYYVRIIARDADGSAPAGAQASGTVFQVPAGSIGADSITAREVVAGSFTGSEFAGEVFIGSTFKTAEAGQRVEWGINGIQGYRADGTRRFNVPTDDAQDIFLDAQIVARGLQVKGGASFEGTQNEVSKDGSMRLAAGVSAPKGTVQAAVFYDTERFTFPPGIPTGSLGPFNFNPTEVRSIAWNPIGLFNVYQNRSNGTRVWRFNRDGSYNSHTDFPDWDICNETWLPGDNNGYILFRFIPAGQQYYVIHNNVYNTYSRVNTSRIPFIGNNGAQIFVGEILSGQARIQLGFRPGMNATSYGPFPAATSTITTSASRSWDGVNTQCVYGAFAGGVGGNRYCVSEVGGTSNLMMFDANGNWLDDDFEAPGTKQGFLYDGSNFWTLGYDGNLYKHTTFTWTSATSSTWWLEMTLRDANVSGGTHETTPGPVRSLKMNRRAKLRITFPPLPYAGGVDDPDRWVLYIGRGAAFPGNAAMWEQTTATLNVNSVDLASLVTSGTSPPTVNNFPGATPGKIVNDDGQLAISGDGSVKAASLLSPIVRVGSELATADNVAIRGPKAFWYLSGTQNVAGGSSPPNVIITAWTPDGTSNSGEITMAAGVVTVARAGQYRVTSQVTFPPSTGATRYLKQIYDGAAGNTVLLGKESPPLTAAGLLTTLHTSKVITFVAGGGFRVTVNQNGSTIALTQGAAWTFLQVEYVGP